MQLTNTGSRWRRHRDRAWGGWKGITPLVLLALLVAMATPGSVTAEPAAQASAKKSLAGQPTSSADTDTPDDEESFDEKLREFGYWSGVALSCVPPTKALETERQVLGIYQRIVQLFGTDRGFFYAAALGRGTSITMDPAKCPEFLEKFQKAAAAHRSLQPSP